MRAAFSIAWLLATKKTAAAATAIVISCFPENIKAYLVLPLKIILRQRLDPGHHLLSIVIYELANHLAVRDG